MQTLFVKYVYVLSYLRRVLVLKSMIIYRMAKLNLLSHRNATLALQARQAMASSENLNYVTLAPQAR